MRRILFIYGFGGSPDSTFCRLIRGTNYKKVFKTYYDDARSIPGGHHGNAEAIPAICQAVKDVERCKRLSDGAGVTL